MATGFTGNDRCGANSRDGCGSDTALFDFRQYFHCYSGVGKRGKQLAIAVGRESRISRDGSGPGAEFLLCGHSSPVRYAAGVIDYNCAMEVRASSEVLEAFTALV